MVKCEQLVNLGEDYQRVLLLLLQLALKYEMISKSKGKIKKKHHGIISQCTELGVGDKERRCQMKRLVSHPNVRSM